VEFKDYYQVMGVARDATDAQIKQAYRKLARKYHPDVSKEKDAERHFKEVGEAYEVLKNPDKRAAYDQLGRGPQPGQDFTPPPNWDSGFEFSGAGRGDYSDFFETMFGARNRGGNHGFRDEHAGDHHAKILLDLDASLLGGSRAVTLRVPEIDEGGHVTTHERLLNVQIPKGIVAGQHIRLAGQGARAGGKAGDLYIEVDFAPHPFYAVDGKNLTLELPVAPWEAALGAAIKIPTPTGVVDLKIPAGAHAGTRLRLKGRGIPAAVPGDFYVRLQIALPPAADEQARQAYQALADALPFNPRAQLGV
jgi:curved DNA-binding protein